MKNPLIIGTIVAVLFILAGVGYFLLGNPFPAESPPPSTPSTEQPSPTRESKSPPEQLAPSLEQKIETIEKAIADVCATGESKEITLVFTETEVNDQAAKLLAQSEIPEDIPLEIKSVHVDFQTDNNLVTEIGAVTYGFNVTIKVNAQVGIEGGKPEVQVTDVSFGLVPLPEPLKDTITDLITQKIDDLLSQLTEVEIDCSEREIDLEFTDVSTQPDKITFAVKIKPKV